MHARRTYSRLFPNHTRAGTRWSSFLYEKGSPRGNLARVLVVHLVEGGSSTTGEQTNCDLMRYVKKRGKPCSIHSGCFVRITFDVSRQLAKRGEACLVRRLPRPRARGLAGRGEACLLRLTHAPSPTRAVARMTRRKFYYSLRLLLVPTTLVIEIISYCLEYICPLVDFNMNY